ncbi:pentapeptide repeat-containing protein [Solwaraspora sp. WMMA2056]|uniref:pentapeptide repeat-containing protein n=1 Tax=Solwaraspora sp. WMMA2056 TaxID=3015161 RepID=UPI00259BDA99|nr:pentapeptide repeat-containing protein [Solwaraspora sp. WMMA2056]WJK38926.1 pentapeptide repeat-containing protein [Solwaraspora sp. WMMA2056]
MTPLEELRATGLYVRAARQLGADTAPVRLAGLHALERLGQAGAADRQQVTDVLCAYLQLPLPGQRPDAAQERRVRLAAQQILARHLRPGPAEHTPDPAFWAGVVVDLTGATVIDADFTGCHLHDARIDEATFTGTAGFVEASFAGTAGFVDTRFTGPAEFDRAVFSGPVGFGDTIFAGTAGFAGATFDGTAGFGDTTFHGIARFTGAVFARDALFGGAAFSGTAQFADVRFGVDAWFTEATFAGIARFTGAAYGKDACFDGAVVGVGGRDRDEWPAGWHVDPATRHLVRAPHH